MSIRRHLVPYTAAGLLAATFAPGIVSAPAQEAAKPMFREGTCSGVLCDYIGGSQAPAAQPQKSLFREGECGGVLCEAIGGSQAPKHTEPPPPCGGGLLCDLMPYKMGAALTAGGVTQRQDAPEPQRAAPASATGETPRARKRKVAKAAASGSKAVVRTAE